jgi:hypothetical protein
LYRKVISYAEGGQSLGVLQEALLETFVDPERFRGTCYRAANWMVVGRTTGRGKDDLTHKPTRSIKEVLALPVHRRFRDLLSS